MANSSLRHNRRQFLQASAALSLPLIVPATVLGREGRVPPSEKIQVGVVGLGARGLYLLDEFLRHDDVRVVSICDVDQQHYRDNAWGQGRLMGRAGGMATVDKAYGKKNGVTQTDDFRELCEAESLDAVVVATPDHWHALCTLAAIRAGKDVYCEKPLTHTFTEGQRVYQEAHRHSTVFQTGSQQRSDRRFRHAAELVRNGHLGALRRIEVGLPPGYAEPMGDTTTPPPPPHLDYPFWCGPAPQLPYMRARHHRWWRGHRAYGGGVLMDWIGHHNDIAHWSLGLDKSGPEVVEAVGWTFPETDVYDSPQSYEIRCQFAGGIVTSIASRHRVGTKWIGENGWLYVDRGKWEASDARWLSLDFDPGSQRLFRSPGHTQNFLDCVRSRDTCVAPAETAHRAITPGHLGYVAHALQRPLRWDAVAERVIDDEEANQLLRRNPYRSPWEFS